MLRPDTLALTALLALLTAVGPMSVDLYLPSLPELGRVFGASVPQVQLTLSGYLLCFAIGQIVFGPISDQSAASRCCSPRCRRSTSRSA